MSLKLANGRIVKINDRTLTGMNPGRMHFSRLDAINFFWMLKDIGIDSIEIDSLIMEKVKKFPIGLDFLFRISSPEDIKKYPTNNFKAFVILADDFFDESFFKVQNIKDKPMIIEINADKLDDPVMQKLKHRHEDCMISQLRITGNITDDTYALILRLQNIKEKTGMTIDLCPENRYYNATAVAVDTLMTSLDCITASFMGYGKYYGYAAFEEVATSLMVLIGFENEQRLKILPELAKQFSMLTGIEIPYTKAILGKGIFKYESGIHADGIKKNPSTYEPYDPELIGQERELLIGKHSGSKSIICKLKELGIRCKKEDAVRILRYIRTKSIESKSFINNEEILSMYINIHNTV